MAMMAAALPYIAAAATVFTGVQMVKEGQQANAANKGEALATEQNARQEQAYAQRRAIAQRAEARRVGSRQQAIAAASGGTATDPTVQDLVSDVAGEGEYRAQLELYEGDEAKRGAGYKADVLRREGKQAQKAGLIRGSTSILKGASSLYDTYAAPDDAANGFDVFGNQESDYGMTVDQAQADWASRM